MSTQMLLSIPKILKHMNVLLTKVFISRLSSYINVITLSRQCKSPNGNLVNGVRWNTEELKKKLQKKVELSTQTRGSHDP